MTHVNEPSTSCCVTVESSHLPMLPEVIQAWRQA